MYRVWDFYLAGDGTCCGDGQSCDSVSCRDPHSPLDPHPNPEQPLHSLPISLVGFSKGCVVLNQLLYDVTSDVTSDVEVDETSKAQPEATASAADLISRVDEMIWLDGGHNGPVNTWITDKTIIEHALSQLKVRIQVAVTPYQVRDPLQPWKGRDHGRFTRHLRALGAHLSAQMFFEDDPPSLEKHFEVLKVFR